MIRKHIHSKVWRLARRAPKAQPAKCTNCLFPATRSPSPLHVTCTLRPAAPKPPPQKLGNMHAGMALLLLEALLLGSAHAARMAPLSPLRSKPDKDGVLRVLALGDSITQGAVPSANDNHPYTLQLKNRLEEYLGQPVEVTNGGEPWGRWVRALMTRRVVRSTQWE